MQTKYSNTEFEAGCDEAGRGCLAGPVFAAAVIIPNGVYIAGLNDSKKLSVSKRKELRIEIEEKCIWAVAECSPIEIDELNILWASVAAMHKALHGLNHAITFVNVDGNKFKPFQNIPHATQVKGDARFENIAAASILAKTHRDDYMEKIHLSFPHYQWAQNMGYPTRNHRKAIQEFGICEYHRRSFRLLPSQMEINFSNFANIGLESKS
jgi:ribonuclease HII